MKRKDEVDKLLEVTTSFFRGHKTKTICNPAIVKKAAMDGIVHLTSGGFERGFRSIEKTDIHNQNILRLLSKTPCKIFLIKDAVFKIKKGYQKGTRYSCDIDIYVKDIKTVDSFLKNSGFFLDGVDIMEDEKKTEFAYAANTNVSLAYDVVLMDKERIKKNGYNGDRNVHFSRFEKFNYFYKDGGALDVHLKLSETAEFNIPEPFGKRINGNLFSVSAEFNLLLNSIHFIENFRKYGKRGFQGFLKYISDVCFVLKTMDVDWRMTIKLAEESDAVAELWYYLSLAKKYIDAEIPDWVISVLGKKSEIMKRCLLRMINPYNLFTNRRDPFVFIFKKMYLDGGFINRHFRRIFF